MGAPVRVGLRQDFRGDGETCEGGLISEEDCFVPEGSFRIEVESIWCEGIECQVDRGSDTDYVEPQYLITALGSGRGVLHARIVREGSSARTDSWPIEAAVAHAIGMLADPLSAGAHHGVFVGTEVVWERRLTSRDAAGGEIALAQTVETIGVELEGSAFGVRPGGRADDTLSLDARRPGTTVVHLRSGALQRMLELVVVDRAEALSLEVVAVDPAAARHGAPAVDVETSPLRGEGLDLIVLEGSEPAAFALRAVFEDGTRALGGLRHLGVMPSGEVKLVSLGADAFFTLQGNRDGDALLVGSVGQAALSLTLRVRSAPGSAPAGD